MKKLIIKLKNLKKNKKFLLYNTSINEYFNYDNIINIISNNIYKKI